MIGTFDPHSRPLLLEIDVPTPDGRLYAGMYAHAKILLQTPRPALLIQDNTIQIDSSESRVVIVAFFNKIHVTSVKLRRDFGTKAEILLKMNNRFWQGQADFVSYNELLLIYHQLQYQQYRKLKHER